jgi:hypothetical protein
MPADRFCRKASVGLDSSAQTETGIMRGYVFLGGAVVFFARRGHKSAYLTFAPFVPYLFLRQSGRQGWCEDGLSQAPR